MTACQIIAMTLYMECANQGHDGHMAVASVIWNSADGKTPLALANECTKPKRYSCWNHRKPDIDIIRHEILCGSMAKGEIPECVINAWTDCLEIAYSMVSGTFQPTTEANHYHTDKVSPYWAKSMLPCGKIGSHIFWKSRT